MKAKKIIGDLRQDQKLALKIHQSLIKIIISTRNVISLESCQLMEFYCTFRYKIQESIITPLLMKI